jgi:PAS domain S-box-containing protein
MDDTAPSPRPRAAALCLLAGATLTAYLIAPAGRAQNLVSDACVAVAAAASAVAVARWSRGWPSARPIAVMFGMLSAACVAFLVRDLLDPGAYMPEPVDLMALAILVPLGGTMRREFNAHIPQHDRWELAIDVGLFAASLAAIAYLLVRPIGSDAVASGSAGVFSILAAALFTTFAVLALWVPGKGHLLLFLAFAVASMATLTFGRLWANGDYTGGSAIVDLAWMLAPIGAALVLVLVRHDDARAPMGATARSTRPILASAAVITACAALTMVALLGDRQGLERVQSSVMILLLGGGIAVRILASQLANARAQGAVRDALRRREEALRDTDEALERVREVNETLRRSEEHLRLVFDAAVDGFVELDDRDHIVRANDAFARMVGLDRTMIETMSWQELSVTARGGDESFASLPVTGEAQLRRTEGPPLHLESRISAIPTDPPRRLLAVRDVTAAKIADQTIRSLFQFLQDRDEDRTRLFRRTNAAIEQERNRVARDLHDGPVQGVSAASLSLEAALLTFKAGDVERGIALLATIREELAHEADVLRRLMAGLRPPVLEERGLIPALRDTLAGFGKEHGVHVEFSGTLLREVPDDLETLVYRVVQEALANIARHAAAEHVAVLVGSDQSQLRIEVEDDGHGFDTSRARDFLHAGRVGLASMRERVELASGTFTIRSTPGRGTALMVSIPLDVALVVLASDAG